MFLRRRKLQSAQSGALALEAEAGTLAPAYRARSGRFFTEIYDVEQSEARHGGRFRWMVSTCLAATVGAIAILVVVYGSAEKNNAGAGLLPTLQKMGDDAVVLPASPTMKNAEGLKWVTPKADRLQLTSGALSTRYIIHESTKSRRDGREYVHQKPYARIVSRLSAVPSNYADVIPPFNPFKLYANNRPVSSNDDADANSGSGLSRSDVSVKVVELLGGILPGEDGQELDAQEVQDIVEKSADQKSAAASGTDSGLPLDGVPSGKIETVPALNDAATPAAAQPANSTSTPNTTNIVKAAEAPEDNDVELEGGEVKLVKAGKADTLAKILADAGADPWQARAMIDAAHNVFPESALVPGQEIRITLVPSLTQANKQEPARYSIFSDGHDHIVTVTRNASGEFVASTKPQFQEELQQAAAESEGSASSTLYASVYHAGLVQNLTPETIGQVLRVHAFDTDFRRRVRPGDSFELFFDMKEEQSTDGNPGELLYTAITSGGAPFHFYRFRTPDGVVDYYDDEGNNSKKFLMRKPVRGDDVRLTSGFGVRFHPLLNTKKMHTGVDWACADGTPVLASGTGVVEEVGHKGYYGNYIRIRHANGYHTAYGHMHRFAAGVEVGTKVRQGQTIGFVGSTGLSSGPHLHFEVLVNSRFVDPMSIQVPRERKLAGKDLADFQKERARIDELMKRAPVMTASK